jgi:rSAM/selenodomain-associated transferase 1
MPRQALLVFARAPEVGHAKTRLIPALGPEGAAALHAGLVERTLLTAGMPSIDLQLWCHPDPRPAFFQNCAARFGASLHGQQGADLGERMANGLTSALASYDQAVLIGTDCPSLDRNDLADAFTALEDGADVVLGPAGDGGYYLLGLSRPCVGLFTGIAWGSDRVLAQTLAKAKELGLTTRQIATRTDLDTPADLQAFHDRAAVIQRGQELVELDR